MKTSARNFLSGTITAIRSGVTTDEVELAIGDDRVCAAMTHTDCVELGLTTGMEVYALIKAPSVIVVAHPHRLVFPSTNHLHGTVASITTGAVNSEVVVDLEGGASIAAIITQSSADGLGLSVGDVASVIFKASSVFLAVKQA
jgi:molybdate transport system regulatory protein